MLILCDRETGAPYVVEVAAPGTVITVSDMSAFHVTVQFVPKRGDGVPVRLVMDYEAAGVLAGVITEAIRPRVSGEVVPMPLTHDERCDCGSCPLRPVPSGDEGRPDK